MLAILPLAVLAAAPAQENSFAGQCGAIAGGFEEARRASSRSSASVATLTAIPSFCSGWTVIRIERHWPADRGARSWWTIRYSIGTARGTPEIRWADSRSCPAMRGVLIALGQLPLATGVGEVPDDTTPPLPSSRRPLPPPPPPPPSPDGTDYTLQGHFQQPDRSSADVTLRTTYGPLANWAENVAPALQACWRDVPPADLE